MDHRGPRDLLARRNHGRGQYLGHTPRARLRPRTFRRDHADRKRPFLKYDYFEMLEDLEPLAHSTPQLELIIHVGARSYRSSISFDDVYARGGTVPDTEIER